MAVGDGTVTEARYTGGNGNYVKIRHNKSIETQYLHMSRFADGVRPGKRVRQGDIIGYVGSTGLATGPHVCFRFWKNGKQVDHRKEELQGAGPLPDALMPAFKVRAAQLDSLALAASANSAH
jgi:murein DD-endopeptidase MepM/ murein hydrolase activator NlpD